MGDNKSEAAPRAATAAPAAKTPADLPGAIQTSLTAAMGPQGQEAQETYE